MKFTDVSIELIDERFFANYSCKSLYSFACTALRSAATFCAEGRSAMNRV